jgi:hypothetical protein
MLRDQLVETPVAVDVLAHTVSRAEAASLLGQPCRSCTPSLEAVPPARASGGTPHEDVGNRISFR